MVITERDPVKAKKKLLEILYSFKKINEIIDCAAETSDLNLKELACKMFGELSIEEPNIIRNVESDITPWCDELLKGNPASYSGLLAKAAQLIRNSLYSDARDLLETGDCIFLLSSCIF